MAQPITARTQSVARWAKVIDHESCIGCHACSTACKSENEVPLSVNRTYVKYVDVGIFPEARRSFQVTRCNQCADAPCTQACPTRAMYARDDGIVDFDKSICIGCKACIAACPYDAIFINPEDHSAEKCNFCAHRVDVGLEPACVVVCPTEALMIGDLNDPGSRVAKMVHREPVVVRRPEKETRPKLFYRGAHQATLDPLAAERPGGGLFMWSEQTTGGHHVVSGHPLEDSGRDTDGNSAVGHAGGANSSAAAVLAYDVPHKAPWDWRVSLYTLTKGIAAGAYLVPLLLLLFHAIDAESPLWMWAAPIVGGVFLGITGLLLISDLEHPGRFYMIFTKAHWRSWLVKGSFIIAGYSAILGIHFLGSLMRSEWIAGHLAWLGLPLAVLTAVYTAYLFAQAKARDLWQSPLLPPHLLVQTLLAGSATLLPVAAFIEPGAVNPLLWTFAGSSLIHVLMVAGETTLAHTTAHARLATHEMTDGRYRTFFRLGVALTAAAVLAPWLATSGVPLALIALVGLVGLLCFEHAYVQAGQSVPLA
ncbi:MAG: polysulfide reductase NrfD [Acidobacteriota bacterium]|nr:polysulfide reductase NrfD [Acidobacteriota bacterium]